jgi:hypothetical protein
VLNSVLISLALKRNTLLIYLSKKLQLDKAVSVFGIHFNFHVEGYTSLYNQKKKDCMPPGGFEPLMSLEIVRLYFFRDTNRRPLH